MRISDVITRKIIDMLDQSEQNCAEIQRNEFAAMIGCVPSQINYVLTSRFTPEHGYIIESQRGGGGYIRISRVNMSSSSAIMHIINSISNKLDELSARVLIENCVYSSVISKECAKTMTAAVSPTVMRQIPVEYRDKIRAAIIKEILISQI